MLWLLLIFVGPSISVPWFECGECKCRQEDVHIVANCSGRVKNSVIVEQVPNEVPITIHTLDLSEQAVHHVGSTAFRCGDLMNLRVLTLYNCQIRSLDMYALRPLRFLEDLDISWNKIPALSADMFKANRLLKRIRLNNNRLDKLPDDLFANLTNLQELFLYGNHLSSIGSATFSNNSQLSYINLEDNKLTYLDHNIIDNLPELKYLIISNNPWRCDCHSEKLMNTLTKRALSQGEFICQTDAMTDRILVEALAENRTCSVRIVAITVTRIKDITTLACKASMDTRPVLIWKILRENKNITISTFEQFTITNSTDGFDNYWLYLTIEGLVDDSRFVCEASDGLVTEEKMIVLPDVRAHEAGLSNWIFYFVGAIAVVFVFGFVGFVSVRRCRRHRDHASSAPDTPSSSYEYDDTALHKMMYLTGSQEVA